MNKALTLLLALTIFAGLVSAEVGFTDTDEFPEEFVGGDTVEVEASFENSAGDDMPLFFELKADFADEEAEMGSSDRIRAFDLDVLGDEVDEFECTETVVDDVEFGEFFGFEMDEFVYAALGGGEEGSMPMYFNRDFCTFEAAEGEHTVTFEISTDHRLRSGSYSLGMELKTLASDDLTELLAEESTGYFEELMEDPLTQSNNTLEDGGVTVEFDESALFEEPIFIGAEGGEVPPTPGNQVFANVVELGGINVQGTPGEYVSGVHVNTRAVDFSQFDQLVAEIEEVTDRIEEIEEELANDQGEDEQVALNEEEQELEDELKELEAELNDLMNQLNDAFIQVLLEGFMSGDEVFFDNYDIGGNITMEFDQAEVEGLEDLAIYRLEDAETGNWTEIDTEVEGNTAAAEVEHFSVYALFGQEEVIDSPEPASGGGGGAGAFTADVDFASDVEGLTVTFEDGSNTFNREASSYEWEFGDGETGTGQTTTHSYGESGEYEVTLTLVDDEGDEHSVTRMIDVEEAESAVDEEGGEDSEDAETEEPEEESPEQLEGDQTITGQFTEAATNPIALLLLALLAGLAYMLHTGKHAAITEKISSLK